MAETREVVWNCGLFEMWLLVYGLGIAFVIFGLSTMMGAIALANFNPLRKMVRYSTIDLLSFGSVCWFLGFVLVGLASFMLSYAANQV